MTCKYHVTFEFEIQQPITVSGIISADAVRTCSARALDDATRKHPGIKWSSVVILLERIQDDDTKNMVPKNNNE